MQLTIGQALVPGLQAALKAFDQFSKSAEGQQVFTEIGVAIGKLLGILAQVPKYFDLITLAVKVFAAVKIGELFASIGARMLDAGLAAQAFNRDLALIGPRTQAAAASQGFFNRTLAVGVSTLTVYRNALLASTAQTGAARLATTAFAGVLGLLRGGLLVTGTILRGFLAAFGGPVGLVITGITLAVGSWITSVDKASLALGEHNRQLDIVVAGYENAKDKAKKFGDQIAGVTLAQAIKNTDDLRAAFNDTIDDMQALTRVAKAAFSDFGPKSAQVLQIKRLSQALEDVRNGVINIKTLETVLNDIALNAADSQIKDTAVSLLDMVNGAKDGVANLTTLSEAVAKSEAKLRLFQGTATDSDKKLLGLVSSVDDASDAFDRDAAVKSYTAAIDKLTSKIPALADELDKLKDITELNKTAWDGLVSAFKAGDISAITRIISLWSQAGAARQFESDQKLMSGFPDADKSIIDRIKFIEGSGNNPNSSASGIGQFTESTWLKLFDRVFPLLTTLTDNQKLAMRQDEGAADKMLKALTEQNQAALVRAGLNPTPTNTYLAHFLGANDAIKVLLANPADLAKNIVAADSVKANPTVIKNDTSIAQLIAWANQKMGGNSPILPNGQTKQENFDQDIAGRVKALKEENDARDESNRAAYIAKGIAEEENKATEQGVTISKEQIAALKEALGIKYDDLHAGEAQKKQQQEARDALNEIVGLDQQRKNILEEIKQAQDAGDNTKTEELKTQLTDINTQLSALIPKAMAFANALKDEKMIAALQKVSLNATKVNTSFLLLGLNMTQLRSLAESFADGVVTALDGFVDNVAAGMKVTKALRLAFLQFAADFLRQIANMILKQIILNALTSMFPSLGPLRAGHTGGVVGSNAIGGGNRIDSAAPTWFRNALTYHTGGVAGLRPDEVNATLKVGEEVLTKQDPRHRDNIGRDMSRSDRGGQPIKQVLVFDQKDVANAMASAHGEKVFVTFLKNNRQTVRSIIS
jgi:hypothetical protein